MPGLAGLLGDAPGMLLLLSGLPAHQFDAWKQPIANGGEASATINTKQTQLEMNGTVLLLSQLSACQNYFKAWISL